MFGKFLLEQAPLPFLTKNQNQIVSSFFNSLCATTSSELLSNLDFYEQQINLEFNSVASDYQSRHAFLKLSILCGVVVGILLLVIVLSNPLQLSFGREFQVFVKVNFLDFVCADCLIYFSYNSIFYH